VQTLDGIGNRHDARGVPRPAMIGRSSRMVRPSGLRGAGSMKRGQADPFDEP
jgi:hypothetical protein